MKKAKSAQMEVLGIHIRQMMTTTMLHSTALGIHHGLVVIGVEARRRPRYRLQRRAGEARSRNTEQVEGLFSEDGDGPPLSRRDIIATAKVSALGVEAVARVEAVAEASPCPQTAVWEMISKHRHLAGKTSECR
jgi:hypothetical protein